MHVQSRPVSDAAAECSTLTTIAPLGVIKRNHWKHYDRNTGVVASEGLLFVELDEPNRVFFICYSRPSNVGGGQWRKQSRSGWHGKFVELTHHDSMGLVKFGLNQFRYQGAGADWHHDMVFAWNPGEKAYFNTECNCFRKLSPPHCDQKRHKHIKVWEANLEDWGEQLPGLHEEPSWHWVHEPQRFRQHPPPPPPMAAVAGTDPIPLMAPPDHAAPGADEVPATVLSMCLCGWVHHAAPAEAASRAGVEDMNMFVNDDWEDVPELCTQDIEFQ